LISQRFHGPGSVGALATRQAPRDLQRQPAEQEVYDAVGDQADTGEHFQGFAVADLFCFVTGLGCHCCGLVLGMGCHCCGLSSSHYK